jgi:hypothetical protein
MLRLLIVRSLNYSQALSAKEIEALSPDVLLPQPTFFLY